MVRPSMSGQCGKGMHPGRSNMFLWGIISILECEGEVGFLCLFSSDAS